VVKFVEALPYKPEGRGFDSRCCHWLCFCVFFFFSGCVYVLGGGGGTRWCSWLRHCATSRKVAGSIPDGVIGIFH
jgi:hypothetical protein